MIISVWIKLFLDIFNYKVILNIFIIFYLKKICFKIFFNDKTIEFIINWLNIKLIEQRRLRWVLSEKISIRQFYFITQLLNELKYVFTGTLIIITFS